MASIDSVLNLFAQNSFSDTDMKVIESLLAENCLGRYSVDEIKDKLRVYLEQLRDVSDNSAPTSLDKLTLPKIVIMSEQIADRYANLLPADLKCTPYRSLIDGTKTRLVYNLLKANQRVVFEKVHQHLSASLREESAFDGDLIVRPVSVCIDSPPGTGKSFLICALSATLSSAPQVLVYQRALVSRLQSLSHVSALTCCKWLMVATGTTFEVAKILFDDKPTIYEMLVDVYALIYRFPQQRSLVVLDEYTVVSPWFLLTLLVAGKVHNFNVICTGDKDQHNAIQKSVYHNRTNHAVVEHLVDHHMKLDKQMRISDKVYNSFIVEYKEKMNVDNSLDSVPNTFANLYYLFTKFMRKFFVKEKLLGVVYMSQFHSKLKARQIRIMQHLDGGGGGGRYYTVPFKHGKHGDELVDLQVPDSNRKFLPYLLLIVGQRYIWTTENDRFVVTLLWVSESSVVVECLEEGAKIASGAVAVAPHQYALCRVSLTHKWHNVPDEHFEWLLGFTTYKSLWQYPLRYYCSTYCAAQGLTFNDEIVELDLDTITANSIYVGLSRVTKDSQIYAMRTKHLASLMYTWYKNDAYYYKLTRTPSALYRNLLCYVNDRKTFVDTTPFVECATKEVFEEPRVRGNVKVLRDAFVNRVPYELCVTELVSVGKFMCENLVALFGSQHPLNDSALIESYKTYVVERGLHLEPSRGVVTIKRRPKTTESKRKRLST